MNNLTKINCLLLISMTLLFSCSTSKSFNERHYNNRYYIGMSERENSKKNDDLKDEITQEIKTTVDEFLVAEPAVVGQSISEGQDITKEQDAVVTTDSDLKEVVAGSPKENFTVRSPRGYPANDNASERSVKKSNTIVEIKQGAANTASEDEALSLLWIIVIVLLILWAFGYIAGGLGMGGLIHLLLVIALILLILWLLRIL